MRPLVKQTPTDLEEQFNSLINPHIIALKKYCLSLGKTKWDGEDLMQETLSKAYVSWLSKSNEITKTYLFRIASNTWIDIHRKRKLIEDVKADLSYVADNGKTDFSERTSLAMEMLLHELTPKQRIVTILLDGFGLSSKECAELIKESEGSVKASLHRARKKLKSIDSVITDDYKTEDHMIVMYLNALQNGSPKFLVKLYKQEVISVNMLNKKQKSNRKVNSNSTMVGFNDFYLVVVLQHANGNVLFVPFLLLELFTLYELFVNKYEDKQLMAA
ncbi:RNA polymerase sigma factor [Aquibacillus kalidii]|uniref:RNA polymerase sigma factor n=1 Tax=Aquibacillus kalidii TaxID=2762597 RepID=UPI0016461FD8|nr:RNA polymerase sigma factor [Aquibacillus kalidii]